MKTISSAVEETIKSKPFLQEAIHEGIINFSGLSRILKPEIETILNKEVKNSAIVVALKRISPYFDVSVFKKLEKMLSELGEIIIRTNLEKLTYSNSPRLMQLQGKIWDKLSIDEEVFFTFSRGVFETTFVFSKVLSHKIKKIFEKELLKNQEKNLSSITIKLPKNNYKQPGLYYYLLKNIAWEGINIFEIISTTNEFTIILDQNQVEKTLKVINNLRIK